MLQLSAAKMNSSRANRGSRSRTGTPDRGGIRKRGAAPRVDRDGDLDMGAPVSGRGRGIRGRGRADSSRRSVPGSRSIGGEKDKTLDALQKAIFDNNSPQASIRHSRGRSAGSVLEGGSSGRGGLQQLKISGWRASKAATNPDGGIESLVGFIEKKATPPDPNTAAHLRKITKSRVERDALIISIRPEQVDWILRINGYLFAGAPLTIEKYDDEAPRGPSAAAVDTKARMTAFLAKRYQEQTKVLDLSKMGTDPDLVEMGMFNSTTTQSKFFPALMKVGELNFDSAEKRRNAVHSVSLAHNQLANVAPVTTLSQTFPDLKNLDLSHNQIKSTQNMSSWRWKFRHLEFLDLSENPVSTEPDFKETMLKWYPKLQTLNNVPVRTPDEIATQKKTPIPIMGPSFVDEARIAENFINGFFNGFDSNRDEVLNNIYDSRSIFSLNVNTSAPRAPQTDATPTWDSYIKKSRNLLKINHLPAQMARSYVGTENIRTAWNSLPKTKHPDILQAPREWLIECHPIPGLPDPNSQSATGVGGLLIMVHGKFDEYNEAGNKVQTRSFDRTFVLGPGHGFGGLRVSNDMLCLRAFGGSEAWVPESQPGIIPSANPPATASAIPSAIPSAAPTVLTATTPQPNQPVIQPAAQPPAQGVHPQAKEGYGVATPGKPDDQVKKEQLVLEVSFRTKMTLEFSEMALTGNNWNLEATMKNFEELKAQGTLPANAFLPGV